MTSYLGLLSPGRVAKMNVLGDLVLLTLTTSVATWASQTLHRPPFLWVAILAPVWILTAAALRHYDPGAADRSLFDDVAMVSVLVAAVTTVQAAVNVLFARELA